MRGTGPVEVNGFLIYAQVTDPGGGSVRLRLSADEWDRLDAGVGHRVRVGRPGREPAEVLVTAADRVPPFVWLDLLPLVSGPPASRAG